MPHFFDWRTDQLWQSLAAERYVLGKSIPPICRKLQISRFEPSRSLHASIGKTDGALAITGLVEWVKHLSSELGSFLQYSADRFLCCVFEPGKPRYLTESRKFVHHEVHFGQRRAIFTHQSAAVSSGIISNRSPTRP